MKFLAACPPIDNHFYNLYFRLMQFTLKNLTTGQLEKILLEHTKYYMTLGKGPENMVRKKIEREKINDILKELEVRHKLNNISSG